MNDAFFLNSFHFNVFSFDKPHSTDLSVTPCPRHFFGCLISGSCRIETKEFCLALRPGEIFYLPKGEHYRSYWFPENGMPVRFYSFGFDHLPVDRSFHLQKIECGEKAMRIFDELCAEIPMTHRGIGKLYYFFGEVADRMSSESTSADDRIVEQAAQFIREHTNCRISDAAKHCGISVSGIYYLFKKKTGKTPNEFRLQVLCDEAVAQLTATDRSVQEISDRLGFSSVSYFRKILKKHTGKTPREIRKENIF